MKGFEVENSFRDALDIALPLTRLCLTLCGVTILKLENSGGIVVSSKKHWSPGGEVSVQSVARSVSGGWIVSGSLTPNGICPDVA
jgi:hypothetical protein